jgi:hypothetical protein
VRDDWFYTQLGFEHGYEGAEPSYPDAPSYREGYDLGVTFRDRVLRLAPTLERDRRGNLSVVFRYVLGAAKAAGGGEAASPGDGRHHPTVCHLCGAPAVAVFYFSHGCYCDPTTVQPLCAHHAHKSGPGTGGGMELVKDLSVDGSFAKHWAGLDAPAADHEG